jgi:hypothetical protein
LTDRTQVRIDYPDQIAQANIAMILEVHRFQAVWREAAGQQSGGSLAHLCQFGQCRFRHVEIRATFVPSQVDAHTRSRTVGVRASSARAGRLT